MRVGGEEDWWCNLFTIIYWFLDKKVNYGFYIGKINTKPIFTKSTGLNCYVQEVEEKYGFIFSHKNIVFMVYLPSLPSYLWSIYSSFADLCIYCVKLCQEVLLSFLSQQLSNKQRKHRISSSTSSSSNKRSFLASD